jgi:hypothetical protein
MTNILTWGLLALFVIPIPTAARPDIAGQMQFDLASASGHARYGLLIATPDAVECHSVRFIVRGALGVVGQSQPFVAGDVQVVRIGGGYPAGVHALRISASGCPVHPAVVRGVRLGKPSPDHGWRAAAVRQMAAQP